MEWNQNFKNGCMSHRVEHKLMKFKLADDSLTKSDKDFSVGLSNHFEDICKINNTIYWNFTKSLLKKAVLEFVSGLMTFVELGTPSSPRIA